MVVTMCLQRNPMALLFTPKERRTPVRRTMTFEEVPINSAIMFREFAACERCVSKAGRGPAIYQLGGQLSVYLRLLEVPAR
jgi:hypothetical protein